MSPGRQSLTHEHDIPSVWTLIAEASKWGRTHLDQLWGR
jgi:hypothetical protein